MDTRPGPWREVWDKKGHKVIKVENLALGRDSGARVAWRMGGELGFRTVGDQVGQGGDGRIFGVTVVRRKGQLEIV